jgi:hypothetical protein
VTDKRLSRSEILGWAALGAGAGLVAGLALAEWLGDVSGPRVRRSLTRLAEPAPAAPLGVEEAVAAAEHTLRSSPGTATLELTAAGVRRGVVELRGWVATRAERARAVATVRAVTGIEDVLNRILVRGEDDVAALVLEEQAS